MAVAPFPMGDAGFWLVVADPPRWVAIGLAWLHLIGPLVLVAAAIAGALVWTLLGWRWLTWQSKDEG